MNLEKQSVYITESGDITESCKEAQGKKTIVSLETKQFIQTDSVLTHTYSFLLGLSARLAQLCPPAFIMRSKHLRGSLNYLSQCFQLFF